MINNSFKILDLIKLDSKNEQLSIKCIAGKNGLDNIIKSDD